MIFAIGFQFLKKKNSPVVSLLRPFLLVNIPLSTDSVQCPKLSILKKGKKLFSGVSLLLAVSSSSLSSAPMEPSFPRSLQPATGGGWSIVPPQVFFHLLADVLSLLHFGLLTLVVRSGLSFGGGKSVF